MAWPSLLAANVKMSGRDSPAFVPEADAAAWSRRIESVSASAPGHVIAAPVA
jgi:hypothetical protein